MALLNLLPPTPTPESLPMVALPAMQPINQTTRESQKPQVSTAINTSTLSWVDAAFVVKVVE